MKEKLFGKTLSELQEVVVSMGMQKFVAKQIADWFVQKKIFILLTKCVIFPKKTLKTYQRSLKLEFSPLRVFRNRLMEPKNTYTKQGTEILSNRLIFLRKNGQPFCVSSQVGCKMGCLFCMTARQGFQGQLSAGEIVNQIHSLPEFGKLTNVVYMGDGRTF